MSEFRRGILSTALVGMVTGINLLGTDVMVELNSPCCGGRLANGLLANELLFRSSSPPCCGGRLPHGIFVNGLLSRSSLTPCWRPSRSLRRCSLWQSACPGPSRRGRCLVFLKY